MVHGTSPAPGTAYDIPWDGNCPRFRRRVWDRFLAGAFGLLSEKGVLLRERAARVE